MHHNSLSSQEVLRYSRQMNLPEMSLSGQEKLKNARVLCVGLGGLGSSVLLYLAAAGVGTIGIIDADKVELSNLQRQILYRESQITHPKTSAALAQIIALNSHIEVESYYETLSTTNATTLISKYDIVVDCSDNFYTNYLTHDICFLLKKPYVYASVAGFKGYCSLFSGNTINPCLRCLFPTPDSTTQLRCTEAGILGVVPGILGTLQATEVIKWLLGIGQSLEKYIFVADLLSMSFKKIKLTQNPECPLCIQNQPLHQLPYPTKPADCLNLRDYAITSKELSNHLKMPNVSLIDVRSIEEHQQHHIGGKCLPFNQLSQRIEELNPTHLIILYCYSGQRSMQALNILLDAGFSLVKYLRGGIQDMNL